MHDRDAKFFGSFRAILKQRGLTPKALQFRSPNLNAYAERFVQTLHAAPHIRHAVEWLKSRQMADGGWGEDGATYHPDRRDLVKASTASQTAWAVLGLMAAGEVECEEVRRGVEFLLNAPRTGANWVEKYYTGIGFPRVFYLNYHGYSAYFPLWALARYRNLRQGNRLTTPYGM